MSQIADDVLALRLPDANITADAGRAEAEFKEAVAQFRATIAPDMDFTAATAAAAHRLAKLRRQGARSAVSTRLAVLGSTTTSQLAGLLDLFLFAQNIDAEVYEAPYGLMRQEILDAGSELYKFEPRFVFLGATRRDLGAMPAPSDSLESVDAAARGIVEEWVGLWQAAHERLGCQIVQNNFDAPPWRTFGNLEPSQPGAPGNFINQVNRELSRRAPGWVSIHDLDGLAASVGRWNW